MPTYRYLCEKCNHELEELQSITDDPLVRCPACGADALVRVIGGGAGVIFKGSGFYLTDYRKGTAEKAPAPEAKKDPKPKDPPPSSGEKPDKK